MDWVEKLKNNKNNLSRVEKNFVDFINEHPEEGATLSQKELVEISGVSKPVIISCFKKLGYGSFKEFKSSVHEFYSSYIDSSLAAKNLLSKVDNVEDLLKESIGVEIRSLERLQRSLDLKHLERITKKIWSARNVYIAGEGTGSYPAHYLSIRLNRYKIPSIYLGQDQRHYADILHPLDKNDVIILFHYSDKSDWLEPLFRQIKQRESYMVLISGTIHPDYIKENSDFFHVHRGEITFKNSMSQPMYFSNLILLLMDVLFKNDVEKNLEELEKTRTTWNR